MTMATATKALHCPTTSTSRSLGGTSSRTARTESATVIDTRMWFQVSCDQEERIILWRLVIELNGYFTHVRVFLTRMGFPAMHTESRIVPAASGVKTI